MAKGEEKSTHGLCPKCGDREVNKVRETAPKIFAELILTELGARDKINRKEFILKFGQFILQHVGIDLEQQWNDQVLAEVATTLKKSLI